MMTEETFQLLIQEVSGYHPLYSAALKIVQGSLLTGIEEDCREHLMVFATAALRALGAKAN